MPAALASSIAYWISGLSTTGSISFGIALVAGRKRVPSPATGNTALRTGFCIELLDHNRWSQAARLLRQPCTNKDGPVPLPAIEQRHRRTSADGFRRFRRRCGDAGFQEHALQLGEIGRGQGCVTPQL